MRKNRALVRVDPHVLFQDLTCGMLPTAEVRSVGVGQDGRLVFEVVGADVPEGECSFVFETRTTLGGGRAVMFKELK